MRAKQFVPIVEAQQKLFEVNMSPGNLKKLAGGIDALVGIEFEMIVPNVGSIDDDEDREYEPDYGRDERAADIEDIVRFFGEEDDFGNQNSEDQLDRLRDELYQQFGDWQSEKIDEAWSEEGTEFFFNWVKNNVDPDDIADHVDKEEDLFGNRHPDKSDYIKFAEDAWEEGFSDENYQNAYDEFREDKQNEGDFDEEEFLRDIGIRDMSDVADRVNSNISWPYYNTDNYGGDSEMNLESLADEFSDAIGRKVHYSTGYHSGPRTNYSYTVEPDSSLKANNFRIVGEDGRTYEEFAVEDNDIDVAKKYLAKWTAQSRNDSKFKDQTYSIERRDDEGEAGLEFISPPLPIDEALEDVKKIKEWADEKGAYTNKKTGLHMNVSVPGFDPENLDYVKLALLLGDKYLLERFGRSANGYCKSAMEIIEEAPTVQEKEVLFKKLKDNLETMASKVVVQSHGTSEVKFGPLTQRIGKFTSINPKDNRVEFRGPGGDWLGQNFDKIEETLYRTVVALDAAVDPEKYRKEYLKKLTEVFAPEGAKKVKYYDPKDPRNKMQGGKIGPGTGASKTVPAVFTQKGPGTKPFIEPVKTSIETIFLKYMAGIITGSELKSELKTIQGKRKQEKLSKEGVVELDSYDAQDGDYIIEYDNPNGDNYRMFLKRTEQVSDPNQAVDAAMKLEPTKFNINDIENISVTEFAGRKSYAVLDGDGDLVNIYNALTPLQAIEIALINNDDLPKDELTVKLASEYQVSDEPRMTEPLRMAPHESEFVVINNSLDQRVSLGATNSAMALSRALRNNPSWDSYRHQIRVLSATPQAEQPAEEPLTPAQAQQGAGEVYQVSDAGTGGGVTVRANSPEHAIERAREAWRIDPTRELEARLYNA